MKLRKRDDVSLLEATCIFPEDPSSLLVLDCRLSFLSESCYLIQVSFALLGQEIETSKTLLPQNIQILIKGKYLHNTEL